MLRSIADSVNDTRDQIDRADHCAGNDHLTEVQVKRVKLKRRILSGGLEVYFRDFLMRKGFLWENSIAEQESASAFLEPADVWSVFIARSFDFSDWINRGHQWLLQRWILEVPAGHLRDDLRDRDDIEGGSFPSVFQTVFEFHPSTIWSDSETLGRFNISFDPWSLVREVETRGLSSRAMSPEQPRMDANIRAATTAARLPPQPEIHPRN